MPAPELLQSSLDRWVGEGLITAEQAEAVRAFETKLAPPPRRISLMSEALGYVGAVLAIAGGGVALGQVWERLTSPAQAGIFAALAVALAVGGWAVRGQTEPALRRLLSVLWLLSVAATAPAAGILLFKTFEASPEVTTLGTGAAVTLVAGALWWAERRLLQQVALLAGVHTVVLAAMWALPREPLPWVYALAVSAVGTGWAVLGRRGIMEPAWAAMPLGAAGALIGPMIAAGDHGWLLVLGLLGAAAVMALGVSMRFTVFLGIGAVAMFVYLTWAVIEYFGQALGVPLALGLAGVVMLVVAVVTGRLMRFPGGRGRSGPVGQAG